MTKDPWSRSLLDSPSPPPWEEDADMDVQGSFITFNRDNDLLAELDLSRREDRAIVRETPFSLAKQRAQARERPGGTEFRGSIITAEDALKAASGELEKSPSPPPKNGRTKAGWTRTTATNSAPTRASGDASIVPPKGTTTQIIRKAEPYRPAAGEVKMSRKRKAPAKAPAKSKKAATASDDKIQFGLLPSNPSSEFPIVAGFERQRSLPTKPKQPKKRAPAKPKAAPKGPSPKADQITLDEIPFLVHGEFKAQGAKKNAKASVAAPGFMSVKSIIDDALGVTKSKPSSGTSVNTADMLSQFAYKSKAPSSKAATSINGGEPALTATGSTQQTVDLRTPPSQKLTHVSERSTKAMQTNTSDLDFPHRSSSSPILVTPQAIPQETVSHLEALVENGYDLTADTPSPDPFAGHQEPSRVPVLHAPVARRMTSPFLPRSSTDSPICLSGPPVNIPKMGSTGFQHNLPPQSSPSQHNLPARSSPFQPLNSGPRRYSNLMPIEEQDSYPSHIESYPSNRESYPVDFESYPSNRAGSVTNGMPNRSGSLSNNSRPFQASQNSAPSRPSHNSNAYNSSTSTRTNSHSRWAAIISKPPVSDAEWTTLPSRRNRLTIRPESSAPKSSRFHLPLRIFDPPRAGPSREAASVSASAAYSQPTYVASPSPEPVPTVRRVTLWAPTPASQSQSQSQSHSHSHSQPSTSRGYVPPAMRALHQAASTPSHSGYAPMEAPYDLGPQLVPVPDVEDDWTAAWTRSNNIAVKNN